MKKLKRITALILSVLMLMSMSVAVSATANTPTYTLVVNSPDAGYTYTAYQVFTGEYDITNNMLKKIYWSSNIDDTTLLSNKTIYQALAEIKDEDQNIYPFTQDNTSTGDPWYSASTVAAVLSVYGKDDDVVQQFAEVVADYMSSTATGTNSDSGVKQSDDSYNYTISGLAAGYYLIKTTGLPSNNNGAYTRYILAMTTIEDGGTITETLEYKYDLPTIDKDLDKTDAAIGDTITYYLTASLPTDTYDYYDEYKLVFHDTLSDGLTFGNVVAVYVYDDADRLVNESNASNQLTDEATMYTAGYTVDDSPTDGCSFEVTIADAKDLTTNGNALIQVVFTATLNSNAIIESTGNPNQVYLEYSNNVYDKNSTGSTVTDVVITWTYKLKVTKIDADTADAADPTTLEGAQFVLYRINDNSENEYVVVDSNNKVKSWTTTKADASTLVSDADGVFNVIGLDQGVEYYLEETKAPSGYNIMTDVIKVVITAEHTTIETIDEATYASYTETVTWLTDDATALDTLSVTLTTSAGTKIGDVDKSTGTVSVKVENNSGAALPSTGGIGTTIFYIVGGVLVVGAIILLITKKRMGGDDK